MKATFGWSGWHGVHAVVGIVASVWLMSGRTNASTLIQITPDDPSNGTLVLAGWNVLSPAFAVPAGLASYGVANLLDSTGDPTGISLTPSGTNRFTAYNTLGSTLVEGVSGFPVETKRESFFGNTEDFTIGGTVFNNPIATWTFSGFDPDDELTFTFFASRTGLGTPDNREGLYEVVGATTQSTTLDASNNDTNTASVTVKADAGGNVVLNMTKGPNNDNSFGFFYLNAMKIEIIPEPSSAMLVVAAGLGLCLVRRRG